MQTESITILQPLTKPEAKGSCAPSTCSAASNEIEAALALCHRLRDGAARMTRQQFRNSLNRSIGAAKDYADANWVSFQNNPAAFLAHRNPQTQSHDLLRVILEITKQQNDQAETHRADDVNRVAELKTLPGVVSIALLGVIVTLRQIFDLSGNLIEYLREVWIGKIIRGYRYSLSLLSIYVCIVLCVGGICQGASTSPQFQSGLDRQLSLMLFGLLPGGEPGRQEGKQPTDNNEDDLLHDVGFLLLGGLLGNIALWIYWRRIFKF